MRDDNEPAFPSAPTIGPNGELMRPVDIGCEGLTIRDYFAAKALAVAWDAFDKGYFESDNPNKEIATSTYQLADEMMEARK